MSPKLSALLALLGISTATWSLWPSPENPEASAPATHVLTRGPLMVWSSFEGTIQSRDERPVFSQLSQRASIVELAPEGSTLEKGEVLARFDDTPFTRSLIELEKNFIIAQSELDRLANAELPLQLGELEGGILDAAEEFEREKAYLADVRQLRKEQLMSDAEVALQERKVEQLKQRSQGLQRKLELTRTFMHPAAMTAAKAKVTSAERELAFAREQEASCVIRAPRRGFVMYKPIHIDGEYRPLRVGDSVFRNQVFMILADPDHMLARCHVPEGKLSLVQEGMAATVSPIAWPDLLLKGRVNKVGSMAHRVTGKPNWQQYVTVEMELTQHDPRLRSGMSAFTRILSHANRDALLLPRAAVEWTDGASYVMLEPGGRTAVTLGPGDDAHFEVRDGLSEGQAVRLP